MRLVSALCALSGLVLAGCAGMNGGSVPQAQPFSAFASAERPISASQHHPLDRRVFGYTHHGDIQTFVVPAAVTQLSIEAAGAQGGDAGPASVGGEGGSVQATIPVSPGEALELRVGGRDGSAGGIGVGSCKGARHCDDAHNGGAGGGASEVFHGATLLIVAGGGGGAGGYAGGRVGGKGGAGGLKASAGEPSRVPGGSGGEGATQTGGGHGGAAGHSYHCPDRGNPGFPGTSLVGGNGGGDSLVGGGGGGGGGAGYFGGGGGGSGTCIRAPDGGSGIVFPGGGGGGGSSFAEASATNVTYVLGGQTGDGRIVITW